MRSSMATSEPRNALAGRVAAAATAVPGTIKQKEEEE